MPQASFDVFLSYSRADKTFVSALARQLGRYTPPASLGLPARRLQPFMDTSDLVGTDYFSAIQHALAASRKLVVICSPAARRSTYVQDEIERFLQQPGRTASDVIALLLAGTPNNEATRPEQAPEMAFPEALYTALTLPLAVDYRGFTPGQHKLDEGAYANAWFVLLANVLGVDRATLEEREARRQRQRRWWIGGISGSVMTALAGLATVASWQRAEAVEQRQSAYARQLAAQAQVELADERGPAEAALERALAALQLRPDAPALEALQALAQGVGRLPPQHLARLALEAGEPLPRELVFSADGQQVFGLGESALRVWQAGDGRLLARHRLPFTPALAALDPTPQGAALWLLDPQGQLWHQAATARPHDSTSAPQLRYRLPPGETGLALRPDTISPGGGLLVTRRSAGGGLNLRELGSGRLVRALEARLGSEFLGWLPGPRLLHLGGGDAEVGSRLLSLDGQPLFSLGDARAAQWQLGQMGQIGRQDPIVALASSADGQRIATARKDGRVSLWHPTERPRYGSWGALPLPELESLAHLDHGDELGVAPGWAEAPAALVLSPDGRFVASQSAGVRLNPVEGVQTLAPRVRIWDVDQRREIARLQTLVGLLRFSPQGQRVLTAGPAADGSGVALDVWQLAPQAGRLQPEAVTQTRQALPEPIRADVVRQLGHARLSANGQRAVWLTPQLELQLWHAQTGQVQRLDSLAPALQQALQAQEERSAQAAKSAQSAQNAEAAQGAEAQAVPPVAELFKHWQAAQAQGAASDAAGSGASGASGGAGASRPGAAVAVPLAISPDGCCAVLALGERLRFYDLAAGRLLRELTLTGRVPGPSMYGAVVLELLLSEGGRFVALSAMERAQLEAIQRDPERASQPGQPWLTLSLHRSEDLHLLHHEPVRLLMAAPVPVLDLKPLALAPDGSGLTLARVVPSASPPGAGTAQLRVQALRVGQPQASLELLAQAWAPSHPMDLAARLHTVAAAYAADTSALTLRQTAPDCPTSTRTNPGTLMPTQQASCARLGVRYRSWRLADGSIQADLTEVLTLPEASQPRPDEWMQLMQDVAAAADPLALLPRLVLPGLFMAPVVEGSPFAMRADGALLTRHDETPATTSPGSGTAAGSLLVRQLRADPQRLRQDVCARLPQPLRQQAPAWAAQFSGAVFGPVCAPQP